MNDENASMLDPRVESLIDAFEVSLASDPQTRLGDFVPARSDPQFIRIATELVRIDLEVAWAAGLEKSVGDYEAFLPELARNRELRGEIAFEEFRQRHLHGQEVAVEEFSRKYDVATENWSTVVPGQDETTSVDDFDSAARQVPSEGQRWRDFEIQREIGRGALSRVLLARQTSLSSRFVVLKFAPKHLWEAEKLARLQHPNIVPVFSVYEDREFHVFCMPYVGDQTLAEHEQPFSEGEALLLIEKLARALEHAHGRGILHNDIKPANILLGDDSQPMLLDFNLAVDARANSRQQLGGTLPYMAPESLQGLAEGRPASDERSDIFSLGAVLFELLTSRQPFGKHDTIQATSRSRQDRIDWRDVRVSPGVATITQKCLAIQPTDRYQTAAELVEDLQRQRQHGPLKHADNRSLSELLTKWCRRHPRLSSFTTVAAVVTLLFAITAAAWFAREQHVDRMQAALHLSAFQEEVEDLLPRLSAIAFDAVEPHSAMLQADRLFDTYVGTRDNWQAAELYRKLSVDDRQLFESGISKLAFYAAACNRWMAMRGDKQLHTNEALRWNALAQAVSSKPFKAQLFQQGQLLSLAESPNADAAFQKAHATPPANALDLQLMALLARFDGRPQDAIESLQLACDESPRDFLAWFDLGLAHVRLGDWQKAENRFTTALALRPESQLARYCRGLARHELGLHLEAITDFTTFLAACPNEPCGLLNRAIAYKATGNLVAALSDLNAAIELGDADPRALIIRSRVRRELGDLRGSTQDLAQALDATPTDELGWVARGVATIKRDPRRALADFDQALALNPISHSARRNKAHVLSERLGETAAAIECLNMLIRDYPDDAGAIGGRGVLLARLGKFKEAIADANRVVELNAGPRPLLQAACVYSMASKTQPKFKQTAALLLGTSLRLDPELARLAERDGDLEDIHEFAAFKELCKAAKQISAVPNPASVIDQATAENWVP